MPGPRGSWCHGSLNVLSEMCLARKCISGHSEPGVQMGPVLMDRSGVSDCRTRTGSLYINQHMRREGQ